MGGDFPTMFTSLRANQGWWRPPFPGANFAHVAAAILVIFVSSHLLPAESHAAAADETSDRPNVVLIMADDIGIEGLGCYGGVSYKTPALDKLARQGMRFTHAYSQPLCTNTRIQLMTGLYNNRNWLYFGILDPTAKTFGHWMQEAGYKTCIAGKWQLQSYDPPDYPGAEKRRGTGMKVADAGFDEYSLWHTGHTEVKGSRYADPTILENGKFRSDLKGGYGPDVWVEYINGFMERNRDEPFFRLLSDGTSALADGANSREPRVARPRDSQSRRRAFHQGHGRAHG